MNMIILVLVMLVVGGWASPQGLDEHEGNAIARGFDPKGMLSTLASSFMPRGYIPTGNGASQVVSLNLTNLFVLVLLKALIFAAGSLGAGTWKGGLGRSLDGEEKFLTEEEILMFVSYLTGAPGDNGCLQSISCHQPEQAKKYIAAGTTLLKASKMFNFQPDVSYDYVLQEMEQAANTGLKGQSCDQFICDSKDRTR